MFGERTFEQVRYDIVERYLKDYALRSILYYYDNVASAYQKAIVEEVAHIYVGATFDEESCLASVVGRDGSQSSEFFLALLGRHDLGAGFRDQLYNSYYAFYLSEGYNMLDYAVDHSSIDETDSNGKFVQARNTVTSYAERILSQNASLFNNVLFDYLYGYTDAETGKKVEGMVHRYYRAELRQYVFDLADGSINGLTATAKNNLTAAFVDKAYDIYYTNGYRAELDSILR